MVTTEVPLHWAFSVKPTLATQVNRQRQCQPGCKTRHSAMNTCQERLCFDILIGFPAGVEGRDLFGSRPAVGKDFLRRDICHLNVPHF